MCFRNCLKEQQTSPPSGGREGLLLYTVCIDRLVDTAEHTLQGLARTTLYELVGTVGNHILRAFRPADARSELCYEVILYFGSIGVSLCVYILIDRALGTLKAVASMAA